MELKTEYKTHDVTGTQTVSDLQEKPKKGFKGHQSYLA